jgi:hypothetical protein
MLEWVGYLGSVLVAISITINGGFYFRIINMAGAICFLVYSISIHSLPITIINFYSIGINIYHLIKINREKNKETK